MLVYMYGFLHLSWMKLTTDRTCWNEISSMCLYVLFVPFPKARAPFLLAIYTTSELSSGEHVRLTSMLSLKRNIVIGSPLLVLLVGSAPMSMASNFLMKLRVDDKMFAYVWKNLLYIIMSDVVWWVLAYWTILYFFDYFKQQHLLFCFSFVLIDISIK